MNIDLTQLLIALIGAIVTVLGSVAIALVNAHVKDATARGVLATAITNSLGAGQQAADGVVVALKPTVAIPGVPAALAPQVQYVLDHASDEATMLGVTPLGIASKINAQIGLAKIAANTASAGAKQ